MNSATKGSELVGLVPLDAMLEAGRWYGDEGLTESEYIDVAVEKLGLNSISNFEPKERIIEWAIMERGS